jgi:hypothetical protein
MAGEQATQPPAVSKNVMHLQLAKGGVDVPLQRHVDYAAVDTSVS